MMSRALNEKRSTYIGLAKEIDIERPDIRLDMRIPITDQTGGDEQHDERRDACVLVRHGLLLKIVSYL